MKTVELTKIKEGDLPGESAGGVSRRGEIGLGKLNVQQQSVQLPDTNIRVCSLVKDGNLLTSFYDDVKTLYDAFQRGLSKSKHSPCLGWRPKPDQPYKWLSYEQVYSRAQYFGSGLVKQGFEAGQETMIGIYSANRIGWVITEQAANMYSMIIVPLYDTLGAEACKYICNQTEVRVVVCDNEDKASLLLTQASEMPSLKTYIVMDSVSDEFKKKASAEGVTVHQFIQIEREGENNLKEPVPPKPEDLCTICYTSGTTGNPKGVMLTHGNFIVGSVGNAAVGSESFEIRTGDVYISYLPLAHVYERFAQLNLLMHGASIGFFQGDIKLLLDDVKTLRPTFFPCVPRVMNRIYDRVMSTVAATGGIKAKLFHKALREKKKEIQKGIVRNNGFWDIFLKKPRMSTGGRVRAITTGAAPVSPEIKMFFRAIFGCYVIEGYGQTETGTLTSITSPRDLSDCHVGCILPCLQVKLIDVPDLEYFASNGQGEVCVKGGNIFQGYYKDPEKTAEAIDDEGYLHSGDVGEFLPNGQLKIIDRVKHIFKLSQGEYVAPEKIENEYLRTEGVAQIFVHGESLQDCCVAIVIPDEEWLGQHAAKNGWEGEPESWCAKPELKKVILDKMNETAKLAQLKGFEQVKNLRLHAEAFSVENGLLTPTLKSKRPIVRRRYQEDIIAMYQELADKKAAQAEKKAAAAAAQNGSAANGAASSSAATNGAVKAEETQDSKPSEEDNGNETKEEESKEEEGKVEETKEDGGGKAENEDTPKEETKEEE